MSWTFGFGTGELRVRCVWVSVAGLGWVAVEKERGGFWERALGQGYRYKRGKIEEEANKEEKRKTERIRDNTKQQDGDSETPKED